MASVIKLKRNSGAGNVPSDGALAAGELAINLADKKLFSSSDGTDVIQISGDAYSVGTVADTDGGTIKLTGTGNAANTQVVLTGANGIGITSDGSGAITVTANTVDSDLAVVQSATMANLQLTGGGETDTVQIVGDDHLVVAATNTSHVSVKLGNTLSVSTVTTTGDITAGADVDITGEVNAATGAITTSLVVGTGGAAPLVNTTALSLGTGGGEVIIGNNSISLGNSTVNTAITATALHTDVAIDGDSTINISGVGTFGDDVDISGEVNAATAAIVGAATIGGNLTVTGDLTVSGTTTEVSSTTVTIDDPMLSLADNQADTSTFTDGVDVGFYGVAGNTSSKFFYGIARDQSANTFIVYNGISNEPGTTVDLTGGGISQLDAIIDGGTY